jgi:hypothetical protein
VKFADSDANGSDAKKRGVVKPESFGGECVRKESG